MGTGSEEICVVNPAANAGNAIDFIFTIDVCNLMHEAVLFSFFKDF